MNQPLLNPTLQALRYVANTGGGATPANFIEDHNPIGAALWRDITDKGLATTDPSGRIILTSKGRAAIEGKAR